MYTLWRQFKVCLCDPQTLYLVSNRAVHTLSVGSWFACAILKPYTSSEIVLCTHFRAGSGFACAILIPCTSSQTVLCTHFRAGSRFACAILKPCTSSEIVLCTHFGARSEFVRECLRQGTSSEIVLCTHVCEGSRFACAILKPCTWFQIVLCTHSRLVHGLPVRSSNLVPRLKSCCVYNLAPVRGLPVRAPDLVPDLKSSCVHTFAPVQGLSVRSSNLIPRLKSCCAHTFAPVQICLCEHQTLHLISNRAVYKFSHRSKVCLWDPQTVCLESRCVHTFASCQGLPRTHFSQFRIASTLLEEILSQTLQTLPGTFCAFCAALLGYCSSVSLVQTFSWQEFYRRRCLQTLPGSSGHSSWLYLGTVVQSVLGRTHSLEVFPSQTLTWCLSLGCLCYYCPECPRSHTISWRFFRRRHSPGVPPWVSLDTVVQIVLGRTHFPGGSSVANTLLASLLGYPWILLSRVSSVANTLLEVVPSHLDHRTMVS